MQPTFPGILNRTAATTAHLWPGQDTKEEQRPDLQAPIDLAVYEQQAPLDERRGHGSPAAAVATPTFDAVLDSILASPEAQAALAAEETEIKALKRKGTRASVKLA